MTKKERNKYDIGISYNAKVNDKDVVIYKHYRDGWVNYNHATITYNDKDVTIININ